MRFFSFLNKKKETKPLPKSILKIIGDTTRESIYWEALTHSSSKIKDENKETISFERLEFLGDAVLSTIISQHLFDLRPYEMEGYLTKTRSKIVSRKNLNRIGKELDIIKHLRINRSIKISQNICGDILEALIGAIFIDKGFADTRRIVLGKLIIPYVNLTDFETKIDSFKGLLFEWTQKEKKSIEYITSKEDNAEDLTVFVCSLRIDDEVMAKGRGTSKKKAEENASRRTYQALKSKIKT